LAVGSLKNLHPGKDLSVVLFCRRIYNIYPKKSLEKQVIAKKAFLTWF